MASSRKSSRSKADAGDFAARVAAKIRESVDPSRRLIVGLSGGADSVVLLDCLNRAARKWRWRVSALHVNHQLSPNAGRWSSFCRRLCRARGIPFESVKVEVARGSNLEAAARMARHAVFARQRGDYVVLAHHVDDQVETLLLQLLRGAGVRGLAAMPVLRKAKGGRQERSGRTGRRQSSPAVLRPLLDVTREEIVEYARKRGLKWIEDESNLDTRFRRNFLRHEILPLIERRFPSYRVTIARSARHLAEASRVLDEIAVSDGAAGLREGALAVDALRRLPPARARNLLRYFLAERGIELPGTARLEEAMRQALGSRRDARVSIDLDGARLMRYRGSLHVVRSMAAVPADRFSLRWNGEPRLVLPGTGVVTLARARGSGISIPSLRKGAVTIRLRQGGERLQPDCGRPRRSLKNLLQEARVAPWLRERLPLVFCGSDLVWAAGIGVDCRYQAARGEPALRPAWTPAA